jgi:hypothetical protein
MKKKETRMNDLAKPKPADLAVKKSKRDAGSEIDAFVQDLGSLKQPQHSS